MFVNKSKAIKKYTQSERSSTLGKSSMQIVESILLELERSMKVVATLSEKNKIIEIDRIKRNSHFSRACTAIYSLQTSLDFEKGGKLAVQLFQLYEFCRKQLIKAFTKRVVIGIHKAIKSISQIIYAWKELLEKNQNATN